jgi:hypothetical protein
VRVPVGLLRRGQAVEEALRDDVLDADQVGVDGVAVEEDALEEVLVHLAAEVVRLHLHLRLVLGAMQADDVDVEVLQRRRVLQQGGARLERLAPQRTAFAGGRDRALSFGNRRVCHGSPRSGPPGYPLP